MIRSKLFKFAFYPIGGLCLLYIIFLLFIISPNGQKSFLYLHKLHTAYFYDISKPEHFGFLEKQATAFNITTPDYENLFAWHLLPLGLYLKSKQQIVESNGNSIDGNIQQTFGFRQFQNQQTRLVIYFHGNAGHLVDSWRPASLRNFMTCDSENLHILTFDYRGFGLSSGTPSEEGLIIDGVAAVNWAIENAKVRPEHIVLVGHSLGTAVATAVASHFAQTSPNTTFGGLILISGFTSILDIALGGGFKGVIPVLSPFTRFPALHSFLVSKITQKWDTAARLRSIVQTTNAKLGIRISHAANDGDVPPAHSDGLFRAASLDESAASLKDLDSDAEVGVKGGILRRSAIPRDGISVKQTLLPYGGHNAPVTYAAIAADICECIR